MASAIIHICVAKKINEKLKRDEKNFLLGSIAPDLTKHVGLPKTFSHFLEGTHKEDVPNIEAFTSLYKDELNKDFELGYLVHLYTDKLWFNGFLDSLVLNNSIKLMDGTIINIKPEAVKDLIYNDYTSLNVDLIDYYDLDLSLFYEEFDYPKSNIKEIPMDKINLIVEKMGIIIENSKTEKSYVFDINSVVNFIEDSTEEIYNYLLENNLVGEKMKKNPIIGLVSRFDSEKINMNLTKINEIPEYYVKVVTKHGGIPIGILPVQDVLYTDLTSKDVPKITADEKEKLIEVIKLCDGILLPGGGRWYEYEEFICEYAHEHNIPLLGICQGLQIMGYVDRKDNVDLDDDLKTFPNNTVIDHHSLGVKYVHKVTIEPGTKLFDILGTTEISVNSRHNLNIGMTKTLKISAISEDGIIEAAEDPKSKFYLGVQWHPELMDEYDINQGKIIKEFINSCK